MALQLLGVFVCLCPLLFLAAGYYLGRYGAPIVISRRRRRDRRAAATDELPDADDLEVYRPS